METLFLPSGCGYLVPLKNFLRGMETIAMGFLPLPAHDLKNFLRGMETAPALVVSAAARAPSKTSLEGWKPYKEFLLVPFGPPQKLP